MTSFRANLETIAQQRKRAEYPPELNDAYMMQRLGWTYQELRATPQHIVNEILLVWHLENVAHEAANPPSKKT